MENKNNHVGTSSNEDKACSEDAGQDEESNATAVIQCLKNPLELSPVIKHVVRYMNVENLKTCRFISKEWSSAALLELKRRSKIVFKRLWNWENGRLRDIRIEKTPALFYETFSDTSLAIPFTAFEFSGGEVQRWKVIELRNFIQNHKNILQEFSLKCVGLENENGEYSCDVSSYLSDWLMIKPNSKLSRKFSVIESFGKIIIPLSSLIHIQKLDFWGGQIILQDKIKISPTELTLENVIFFKNGAKLTNVCINDVADFSKARKIVLDFSPQDSEFHVDVSLDFSLDNALVLDFLSLCNIKFLNWRNCNWTVQKLILREVPFVETTEMQVKELQFYGSKIDISVLPKSIEMLEVYGDKRKCFRSRDVTLPNLNYLCLNIGLYLSELLPHFANCPLVELNLAGNDSDPIEIQFHSIPKTVKQLRLEGVKVNMEKADISLNLDQLILGDYSFTLQAKVLQILTGVYFKTSKLVITSSSKMQANESFVRFLHLDKKCLDCSQRFYIGPFNWNYDSTNSSEKVEKSSLVKFVDKEATYYVFENGYGKAVDDEMFCGLQAVEPDPNVEQEFWQ